MKHRKEWYAALKQKYPHNPAFSVANVEQGARNEPVAKEKAPRFDGPVSIVFRSYRHRLADPDGLCGKYALDALVSAGVFPDDSGEYISKVSHEQVKVPRKEQERTEIIIEEV